MGYRRRACCSLQLPAQKKRGPTPINLRNLRCGVYLSAFSCQYRIPGSRGKRHKQLFRNQVHSGSINSVYCFQELSLMEKRWTQLLLTACCIQLSLSKISLDTSSIPVQKGNERSTAVCVQDAVLLKWEVGDGGGGGELVWVEVHDVSSIPTPIARYDLFQYGHKGGQPSPSLEIVQKMPESLQMMHSVIQSWDHGAFKIPEVHTAKWSRGTDGAFVVLHFSEPTNRPPLNGDVDLNNALVINQGEITVTAGRGEWSANGEVLSITDLDPGSWRAITASISSGEFHVKPREKVLVSADNGGGKTGSPDQLRGSLTMRMSFPGRFVAYLFVGEQLDSSAEIIEVDLCPEQVVVALSNPGSGSVQDPQPFFSADGVLSMPGDKWLKVPSSLFHHQREPLGGIQSEQMTPARRSSWSLSLWVYLLDDATGSFRGLFYKGDGGATMGRTPSAWLCPHSNRIALRVTSDTNPDIGADSVASLNVGTWNHVVFTFDNITSGEFSSTIFINGTLDISVQFDGTTVLGNDGPLHIGRDTSNLGPRSLVSLVRLWKGALSPDQVDAVFQASKPLFLGEASTALASRYSSIHATVSMTSRMQTTSTQGGLWVEETGTIWSDPSHLELGRSAYEAAVAASDLCKAFAERLDLYRIASEAGHVESRVRYASLLLTGREQLDGENAARCGRETDLEARATAVAQWNDGGARLAVDQLELAVLGGSFRAAYMLATTLLSGLGGTAAHDRSIADCARCQSYRVSPTTQHLAGVGVGAAVLDQWTSGANTTHEEDSDRGSLKTWKVPTTSRAIALLHFAAVGGYSEAQLALGLRYLQGNGVQLDLETAAYYLACACDRAHAEYHLVGKQPVLEMQRLTAANEAVVEVGQKGEDDDALQYQIHRAEQGDVPSIEAMGDLYYWGARGVTRDQSRALQYFDRASDAGSNNARCAAAGMYLKGEGTKVNHTKAVELFELAAAEGYVRALNGLGYVYFNGHFLPQNFTKAFRYFERASNMKQEADSLFNTAHCLAHGIGTDQDLERAAELFRLGAGWGHVDCAYELGYMYAQGIGVERDPALAAKYLAVVAQAGPWGRRLRLAFDCYLEGDMLSALSMYSEAAELGYEVAASNAAFLLDEGKLRLNGELFQGGPSAPVWSETMAVRLHIMAATKGYAPSFLAIGDAFFYGRAGLPRELTLACWWYFRASSSGLFRGTYNLGYLYEHGLGVPLDYAKALTFYDRARSVPAAMADFDQGLTGIPIQLLIILAKIRLYLNRASGGRLASLWQRQENEDGHNSTQDWLPEWFVLAKLSDKFESFTRCVGTMWQGPKVFNHVEINTPHAGRPLRTSSIGLAAEDVLLLISSTLLLVVLFLRWRRRRARRL